VKNKSAISQNELINSMDIKRFMFYTFGFSVYLYALFFVFSITSISVISMLCIPFAILIIYKKGVSLGILFTLLASLFSLDWLYAVGKMHNIELNSAIIDVSAFIITQTLVLLFVSLNLKKNYENRQKLEKELEEKSEESKHQQLLMLKQNKFAQMGEMIAMIAHQWRQPLNNLALSNQLLISKYKRGTLNDKVVEEFKANSKKQIDMMSDTIDDFRNFFKSEKMISKYCINDVIETIIDMLKSMFSNYDIDIKYEQNEKLYTQGYPNEFGQALQNILINAKDALVANKEEDRKIEVKSYADKEYIIISIKDNGGGIDEKIIDKIFDPYFSTKKDKEGTGLGLYMTKMIIQEQDGSKIEARNIDGGAEFTIFLLGENSDT
jgi:signal transduction histidine kinase